jgi:hypothetical protein
MDAMSLAAIVVLSSILGVAGTRAILVGLLTIMSRQPALHQFTLREHPTSKAQ